MIEKLKRYLAIFLLLCIWVVGVFGFAIYLTLLAFYVIFDESVKGIRKCLSL